MLWGPLVDQALADEAVTSPATPGDISWPLADNQGTIRDWAHYDDALGITEIANHIVYDGFGQVKSETDPNVDHLFGYTGRPGSADTSFRNNLNRWYDPATQRWISEDPIGILADDPNFDRYVGNSPTNATDPRGLASTAKRTSGWGSYKAHDDWGWSLMAGADRLLQSLDETIGEVNDAVVATAGGLKAIATSSEARAAFVRAYDESRIEPLAQSMIKRGQNAGNRNPSVASLVQYGAESLTVARLAGGVSGRMPDGSTLPGLAGNGIMVNSAQDLVRVATNGDSQSQVFYFGVADFAGAAAIGTGFMGRVPGLGTMMYPAAPLSPMAKVGEGYGVIAELRSPQIPAATLRTPLPLGISGGTLPVPEVGGAFTLVGETAQTWKSSNGFRLFSNQAEYAAYERAIFRQGKTPLLENRGPILGGNYRDVRASNVAGDVHHMPADSVSPLSSEQGPAIFMPTVEHARTASFGNSRAARAYRGQQRQLIQQGRFMEAVQMDIDDLRNLYGNRYDEHIRQMLEWTRQSRIVPGQ